MKDTLHYIISSIVNNPDAVEVTESEENGILVFLVKVSNEDIGKVIGKEGRVIKSIKNIMKIPAIKQGKRIQISLLEQTS